MKANEAPEKIYISKDLFRWSFNEPQSKSDIEYIRTDAFIEKVCDYLRTLKVQEFPGAPMERVMTEEDIDVFKEAMKE